MIKLNVLVDFTGKLVLIMPADKLDGIGVNMQYAAVGRDAVEVLQCLL